MGTGRILEVKILGFVTDELPPPPSYYFQKIIVMLSLEFVWLSTSQKSPNGFELWVLNAISYLHRLLIRLFSARSCCLPAGPWTNTAGGHCCLPTAVVRGCGIRGHVVTARKWTGQVT